MNSGGGGSKVSSCVSSEAQAGPLPPQGLRCGDSGCFCSLSASTILKYPVLIGDLMTYQAASRMWQHIWLYFAVFCPGMAGIRCWLLSQGVGCLACGERMPLPWPQAVGPRVRCWLPAREGGSEEEAGCVHCPLT